MGGKDFNQCPPPTSSIYSEPVNFIFISTEKEKKPQPPHFRILITTKIQNLKSELPHYAFGRSGEEANFKTKKN